ncbi:hydrogenase expression protein HupH [Thermobispora bispora]|uniref:Hydrogenase maturation factor HypA n=1 Tax=Thermobispora bispora (strain ATCC 19993 / DSM 43833 / CBS 139.67 / JCM 10125 / KCTC 9307 / NBRC 14880 / R51) TaxID=469371 RepID=D6Y8U8_THEBD|nr:hydrogenase maturation nickel metallochaperone HypA [Thermobispora bispora]MBO2474850.1 hydrogenase expression protein HupH [Actinomycetales bacterium]MDI9582323.1 hydrogenase maturation nickel metallochaperone HypA [Thermobispora sp.]ADG89910.1 hydrogenase expression/synthesis HypA [Thermobispora bispora DSM 43833]MBX6166837.1 hydrogenase maturation nickel metallochaperone HypA [Thermobispora bispora]QSI49485.1 hydrogenase maturation nickel metallochaperone HypA [Thermobispora bispora]
MHELSICQSIFGVVTKHAGERRVRAVNVKVGHLRQIVPDTLVYCWSLVTQDTPLDGAELRVEHVPARIRCTECEHTETITAPILLCGGCGSQRVEIVSGEEFLITSLELAEE